MPRYQEKSRKYRKSTGTQPLRPDQKAEHHSNHESVQEQRLKIISEDLMQIDFHEGHNALHGLKNSP